MFFEFAQTNYFYVDEETLRQRLAQFYSCNRQVGDEDKPWISVAMMVFALGIQFSKHYQSSAHSSCRELMREAHDICKTMDDTAASTLYGNARGLIPGILSANCIESVQAFLLFGLYTLPTDPAGLSLTYFGLATRLATQLNLHQRNTQSISPRECEVQKRVWWTVYALERFVHGLIFIRNKLTFKADFVSCTDDLFLSPEQISMPTLQLIWKICNLKSESTLFKIVWRCSSSLSLWRMFEMQCKLCQPI